MPDMAPVSGPLPIAPAIPVVGLPAPAVQPGLAAEGAALNDLIDLVSFSPAARLQQALDAPGIAIQQLGFLLQEVEQITQLTSRAAPLVMAELAAEIGAAAGELGVGVQALLPPPDKVPPPLQLATAAMLRALGTLAPALRHAGDKRPDLAPAVQVRREALPGDPARIWPTGTIAAAAAAQPRLGSASAHHPEASAPQTLPGAGPDHEVPPVDPGREAQADARAILRSATNTLGRMQLGMDAAAVPAAAAYLAATAQDFGPGYDTARCAAQIALAQAQVARASSVIEGQFPAAPRWRRIAALLDQRSVGLARTASRHTLLVRAGTLLMLLCLATAALWAASQLDLTLARIAAVILLALVGLAWTWRRSASWRRSRLHIELRR